MLNKKHVLIIITVTILSIYIILMIIAGKMGALKDFPKESDQEACDLPSIPVNLRHRLYNKNEVELTWDSIKDCKEYRTYHYYEDPLKGSLPVNVLQSTTNKIKFGRIRHGLNWFRVRGVNSCGEG